MIEDVIQPNWPAPKHVKAYTTLRTSGVSHITANSKIDFDRLVQLLQLPTKPIKINQTHSNIAVSASTDNENKKADAVFTNQPHQVCVISTADCLPVLLSHREGKAVAAIHAGWRGLENGVIAQTMKALALPGSEMLAWLGPAISQPCYEVGPEVRDQFMQHDMATEAAFVPSPNGRWLANLYAIARLQLKNLGITAIFGGDYCTYSDEARFFSYRRDKGILGSMATLIWINHHLV